MLRFLFIIIFLLLITGCGSLSGGPEPVLTSNDEIEVLKESFNGDKLKEYLKLKGSSPTPTNQKKLTAIRDTYIMARMYAIDLRFFDYVQTLSKELRGGGFFLDILSLALSGTATALNPGTTTTILAGTDTAVKAGRKSFNKEILIDTARDIILTQMKSDRKTISKQILHNLKFPDSDYSLLIALTQLKEYEEAGTIYGALINLKEAAAVEVVEASNRLQDEISNDNEYRRLLEKYMNSTSDPVERAIRLGQIQAEINKIGYRNISAADLYSSIKPEYRLLQEEVANELILQGKIKK